MGQTLTKEIKKTISLQAVEAKYGNAFVSAAGAALGAMDHLVRMCWASRYRVLADAERCGVADIIERKDVRVTKLTAKNGWTSHDNVGWEFSWRDDSLFPYRSDITDDKLRKSSTAQGLYASGLYVKDVPSDSEYFSLEEDVPAIYKNNSDEFMLLTGKAMQIIDAAEKFKEDIDTVLESYRTVKQLVTDFPEFTPYIPEARTGTELSCPLELQGRVHAALQGLRG